MGDILDSWVGEGTSIGESSRRTLSVTVMPVTLPAPEGDPKSESELECLDDVESVEDIQMTTIAQSCLRDIWWMTDGRTQEVALTSCSSEGI